MSIKKDGVYVDVTYGGGGHSQEILSRLGEKGKLVVFDRDGDAYAQRVEDERLVFVREDFIYIKSALRLRKIEKVDGILADLGVSSHQFDTAERGFSFRFEGPLDMRMNKVEGMTAAELLKNTEEEELRSIFRRYGELKNAFRLAKTIMARREEESLETTRDFERMIASCTPAHQRNKYLAKVYQALRIAVNGELESLETLLKVAPELIKEEGRLVMISYHSLEDRMVKRYMKSGNAEGKEEKDFFGNIISPWKNILRKAIQADENEVQQNPRARSARLRAAKKIDLKIQRLKTDH